jgi:hypothetical protein
MTFIFTLKRVRLVAACGMLLEERRREKVRDSNEFMKTVRKNEYRCISVRMSLEWMRWYVCLSVCFVCLLRLSEVDLECTLNTYMNWGVVLWMLSHSYNASGGTRSCNHVNMGTMKMETSYCYESISVCMPFSLSRNIRIINNKSASDRLTHKLPMTACISTRACVYIYFDDCEGWSKIHLDVIFCLHMYVCVCKNGNGARHLSYFRILRHSFYRWGGGGVAPMYFLKIWRNMSSA